MSDPERIFCYGGANTPRRVIELAEVLDGFLSAAAYTEEGEQSLRQRQQEIKERFGGLARALDCKAVISCHLSLPKMDEDRETGDYLGATCPPESILDAYYEVISWREDEPLDREEMEDVLHMFLIGLEDILYDHPKVGWLEPWPETSPCSSVD